MNGGLISHDNGGNKINQRLNDHHRYPALMTNSQEHSKGHTTKFHEMVSLPGHLSYPQPYFFSTFCAQILLVVRAPLSLASNHCTWKVFPSSTVCFSNAWIRQQGGVWVALRKVGTRPSWISEKSERGNGTWTRRRGEGLMSIYRW